MLRYVYIYIIYDNKYFIYLQNRGLCLSNSEPIRSVHNSFVCRELFELVNLRAPDKDDNYHFVTFLPIGDRIYELDGLREGPIDLGAIPTDSDWIDAIRPVIERRIQKYVLFLWSRFWEDNSKKSYRYSEGEIHFNLMAVISDRRLKYQQRLAEIAEVWNETRFHFNREYFL